MPHVRSLFEKIAIETEEDYQNIIKKLESFGVTVLRPTIPKEIDQCRLPSGRLCKPPMNPRDYTGMFGTRFYQSQTSMTIQKFYKNIKEPDWPDINNKEDFENLPNSIRKKCINVHQLFNHEKNFELSNCYNDIFEHIKQQGNEVIEDSGLINGAMATRVGRDMYFGTWSYDQDRDHVLNIVNRKFLHTRNHVVNTYGHSDGTFCPVCPGFIISLYDIPTYANTFPGWEVLYLPGQSWSKVSPFLRLKEKNKGKWWIPGFENDNEVTDVVEQWLGHWTGYVEETVFDVNMLIVDPKNVIVFGYNKHVFNALSRYGITSHIVPFRHRYFWDGGIHCVTSDLHREGTMQDYFPQRG